MDKRSLIERQIELHNGNLLCVEVKENPEKSGIYIPTLTKEKRYKILKVIKGDDVVEKDDIIYVTNHAGTEIQDDFTLYVLVNKRDILMLYKHGD